MLNFKKLISITLAVILFVSMTSSANAPRLEDSISLYSYVHDEQIFCTTTLKDDFHDDSIVAILTKAASRDNRDWTIRDFRDIGAVKVDDMVRLSNSEDVYAQEVWSAERNNQMFRNSSTLQIYEAAMQRGKENTLVNFNEYRRILHITLNQNCKENALDSATNLPDDPLYGTQWALQPLQQNGNNRGKINAPKAWNITTGSSTVMVGVI